MKFDWNPDKAAANARKHNGVTFEEAREVFDDDDAVAESDVAHSSGEQRYRIIVVLGGVESAVVVCGLY